jgi:hypothetical protein
VKIRFRFAYLHLTFNEGSIWCTSCSVKLSKLINAAGEDMLELIIAKLAEQKSVTCILDLWTAL